MEITPRINKSAIVPYHTMEAASLRDTTEGGLCAAGVPLHHAKWTPGSTTCTPTHRPSAHSLARLPRELGGYADEDGEAGQPQGSTILNSTDRSSPFLRDAGGHVRGVGAHMVGAPCDEPEAAAQADLAQAERRCARLREAVLLAKERCARAAARAARSAEPPPPPPPAPPGTAGQGVASGLTPIAEAGAPRRGAGRPRRASSAASSAEDSEGTEAEAEAGPGEELAREQARYEAALVAHSAEVLAA